MRCKIYDERQVRMSAKFSIRVTNHQGSTVKLLLGIGVFYLDRVLKFLDILKNYAKTFFVLPILRQLEEFQSVWNFWCFRRISCRFLSHIVVSVHAYDQKFGRLCLCSHYSFFLHYCNTQNRLLTVAQLARA